MSDSLISRSEDLRRLRDEGFELAIVNSQLVISHVPYVTANRTVEYGTLVSELTLAGDITTTPSTHVVRFAGQMPCDAEGRPLEKLVLGGDRLQVAEGITTSYMFSSKPVPPLFYTDYHDKMTTYAAALSGHAESLVPTATARTYRPIPATLEGVFEYLDTATSRSGTTAVGECLRTRSVGIVGLGGTGAYILDFLAKTPAEEIHLFDPDRFLQHNAFRTPGAASLASIFHRLADVRCSASLPGSW